MKNLRKELIDFARWLQDEEYLVRQPCIQVTDMYLQSIQAPVEDRNVSENEPQKEVCSCGKTGNSPLCYDCFCEGLKRDNQTD